MVTRAIQYLSYVISFIASEVNFFGIAALIAKHVYWIKLVHLILESSQQ